MFRVVSASSEQSKCDESDTLGRQPQQCSTSTNLNPTMRIRGCLISPLPCYNSGRTFQKLAAQAGGWLCVYAVGGKYMCLSCFVHKEDHETRGTCIIA